MLARQSPRATLVALALLALVGCGGSCGFGGPPLEVAGKTPYRRCLAAAAPGPRRWSVGALQLAIDGRTLSLGGLPPEVRLVAFSGPGPGPALTAHAVTALGAMKPQVALLVGGVGDSLQSATATVQALAKAPFLTLVLAGGRDEPGVLEAALSAVDAARDRVLPISALRRVVLGGEVLVPVAGAPDGHYARTDAACGFGLADLQAAAGELGHPVAGERRWLLSWHAPGRGGAGAVARDARGLDLGSDMLAEFAERIGAPGGVFAWPAVRPVAVVTDPGRPGSDAGVPANPGQIAVPGLGGPADSLADGGLRPPGFAVLDLGSAGLQLRAVIETTAPPAPAAERPTDAGLPDTD